MKLSASVGIDTSSAPPPMIVAFDAVAQNALHVANVITPNDKNFKKYIIK